LKINCVIEVDRYCLSTTLDFKALRNCFPGRPEQEFFLLTGARKILHHFLFPFQFIARFLHFLLSENFRNFPKDSESFRIFPKITLFFGKFPKVAENRAPFGR